MDYFTQHLLKLHLKNKGEMSGCWRELEPRRCPELGPAKDWPWWEALCQEKVGAGRAVRGRQPQREVGKGLVGGCRIPLRDESVCSSN